MFFTSLLRICLTRSWQRFQFKNQPLRRLEFKESPHLGLYVHIPFCRSICDFCPYCKIKYHQATAAEYKRAILREIEMVAAGLTEKKKVSSLYFGGGTPATMLDDLAKIIDKLRTYFQIEEGIGIELHPDDIDEKALASLKSAGFTMVSIGVQSFDKECLSALDREQRDILQKLAQVRKTGFAVFNIDLIFGMPKQTKKSLIADIDQAFLSGATQISTYPFIDFTFTANRSKPLPEKMKKRMLASISRHCRELGKERTSIWTFAEKNKRGYSSITRDNFLGFGLSAATLLPQEFKINTFSVDAYIRRSKQGRLPTSLTLDFSLRQRAVYYLFWAVYSTRIEPLQFQKIIGKSLVEMFGFELWLAQKLGFLEKEDGFYCLTEKGAYYFHFLEQAYTTSYIDKMWNISGKIPFPDLIEL